MTAYADRLHAAIRAKRTPALVGIDPRLDLLPADIVERNRTPERTAAEAAAGAFEEFSKRLIDAVAPLVPAVKPQAAFFEEYGPPGMAALGRVVAHARTAGLITILDAKRGDIGSTAEAYARGWLGGADPDHPWQADALTVNPYLGADTLEPFVKTATERGAGLYVLVRTSNPGAAAFQDVCEGATNVFERVADVVESLSSGDAAYGPVGAVVGATYPEELKLLRTRMPHVPLLMPGYGAQGGSALDVATAFDADGLGAVVNSSRGINFAFRRQPYADQFGEARWEQAAAAATRAMIADLATVVTVG